MVKSKQVEKSKDSWNDRVSMEKSNISMFSLSS